MGRRLNWFALANQLHVEYHMAWHLPGWEAASTIRHAFLWPNSPSGCQRSSGSGGPLPARLM